MNKSAPISTDKIGVDPSSPRRDEVAPGRIRTARERLRHGPVSGRAFERDILAMHVAETLQSATIMPLFIVLVTGIGIYITGEVQLVGWAMLALSAHVLSLVLARKASRQKLTSGNAPRWHNMFLAAQIVYGCTWALFALHPLYAADTALMLFYKGTTLLIALCTTAMTSFMLRNATLMTFLPVLAALCVNAGRAASSFDIGLALMFAVAMLFCHYVNRRLHLSSLYLLSAQSEKDDLIAELEVAKTMSDDARRRAEEANLAKSRFLASMSHELRTPLNAILGFSEVMASEVLGPLNNPLYKEYSGDIHRSGQHLLNLINEILDLSRIEAGRYELNEEAVSLLEIAEDCVGMVQMRARAKNIGIIQQFEASLPQIWADEKSIRQVVLNLLSNAVKFTPQGGEIVVKAGWTAGGGQYIAIKDNGPGIPEDEIPVVLSAFGQGSTAIKSAEQGTGLGLPIVQAILSKHDGQLVLKSKLREGTEVIAILPAKRVLQSAAAPAMQDIPTGRPRRRSFA